MESKLAKIMVEKEFGAYSRQSEESDGRVTGVTIQRLTEIQGIFKRKNQ